MSFQVGDIVYVSDRKANFKSVTNMRGKVIHTFTGSDNEDYVLVEIHGRDKKYFYHLDKSFCVSKKKGVSLHSLLMANPDRVKQIGINAGIWDENGNLTPIYRS